MQEKQRIQQAKEQGGEAFREGLSVNDAPYSEDDKAAYQAWVQGYLAAQKAA